MEEKMKSKKSSSKFDTSKWPIPACLFMGIGIGLLTGQVAALTLIGLGLGIFITYSTSRKKK